MSKSENLAGAAGCVSAGIGGALFVGLGIAQWMAIYAWVDMTFELPWIIAGAVTGFVGFLPIIGNICGTIGAMNAWHWPWWAAVLLFFGSWIFYWIVSILMAFLGAATNNNNER